MSEIIRLQVLGRFQVKIGGEVVALSRRKVEALFAFLTLHPESHSREKLAALFWTDYSDEQARASLRNALAVLRKKLGEEILLTEVERIQLNPAYPLWVDVRQFEMEAKALQPSALDLYQGDLLEEFYEEWVLSDRRVLQKKYTELLLHLVHDMRSHSQYEDAIGLARRVLQVEPLNEHAQQHLIFCYMASGNRVAALKQYETFEILLKTELGITPENRTKDLYQWVIQSPLDAPSYEARITNLPVPITQFIGRKQDVQELKDLIVRSRLVTLTGAGGSGKTRLAIRVAADLVDYFHDGVWWVELASVTDSLFVPQQVAQALGIREVSGEPVLNTLIRYLYPRQVLLILDNCEHLVEACASLVYQLLSQCPNLHVISTSRESLDLMGETLWMVRTLTVPQESNPVSVKDLLEYESVQLFVERARGVDLRFELNSQNAGQVQQICTRLDGIPLAIELAAVCVDRMLPEEIASGMNNRFALLTRGSRFALARQKTLQALIDWSYDLLTDAERSLFCRFSVFSGGASLEAVESICGGEGGVVIQIRNLLDSLIRKSLIMTRRTANGLRYEMLETIHEYARQKLTERNETSFLADRHLGYFLSFAEQSAPLLHGPAQVERLVNLDVELANLGSAMDWSLKGNPEAGLRFGAALWWYWRIRERVQEGIKRMQLVLENGKLFANTELYATVLNGIAFLALFSGDLQAVQEYGQRGLEAARRCNSKNEIAMSLFVLGHFASEHHEINTLRQQSLALWQEVGNIWGVGLVLNSFGMEKFIYKEYANARQYYEESLKYRRDSGDVRNIAVTISNLGFTYIKEKKWKEALACFQEGMTYWFVTGASLSAAEAIMGVVDILVNNGQVMVAASLWTFVERMMRSSEAAMLDSDAEEFQVLQEILQTVMKEEEIQKHLQAQGVLTFEQVVKLIQSITI